MPVLVGLRRRAAIMPVMVRVGILGVSATVGGGSWVRFLVLRGRYLMTLIVIVIVPLLVWLRRRAVVMPVLVRLCLLGVIVTVVVVSVFVFVVLRGRFLLLVIVVVMIVVVVGGGRRLAGRFGRGCWFRCRGRPARHQGRAGPQRLLLDQAIVVVRDGVGRDQRREDDPVVGGARRGEHADHL